MNHLITGRALAFGVFIFLLTAYPMSAQRGGQRTWSDSQGHRRKPADLDNILKEHRVWVCSKHESGTPADLSGADLSGTNLYGAHLQGAHMGGARLKYLRSAHLESADLEGADLMDAHVEDAQLLGARLQGAYLLGTYLKDAELTGANLARVTFEPKSLPELEGIASAENLDLMIYQHNPNALVQLRKQFEDSGFRQQERKITYSLKRREAEQSWDSCTSRTKTGPTTPSPRTACQTQTRDKPVKQIGTPVLCRRTTQTQ
jgi:Pentapeptide repeats (8 copies)